MLWRRLHLQAIYDYFEQTQPGLYKHFDDMFPIVSCTANFDEILIPADHVSRSANDTYYVSADKVLRCHTSAHQAELLRTKQPAFLVTGAVTDDEPSLVPGLRGVVAAAKMGAAGLGPAAGKLVGAQAAAEPQLSQLPAHRMAYVSSARCTVGGIDLPVTLLRAGAAAVAVVQVTCTAATASTPPTTPCSTRWRVCACTARQTGRRQAWMPQPLLRRSSRPHWR